MCVCPYADGPHGNVLWIHVHCKLQLLLPDGHHWLLRMPDVLQEDLQRRED